MRKTFALFSILLASVLAFTIPDSVRYSNGPGMIASVSSPSIDYLKQEYLPYIYDKISDLKVPDQQVSEALLNLKMVNITAQLLSPKQMFIKSWLTKFQSKDNSLNISTKKQDMEVNFDFNAQTSFFRWITDGHLKAKISKIAFDFKIIFDTQKAKSADSEMVPALLINVNDLSIDKSESDIEITGGNVGWCVNYLVKLFKGTIFNMIIKDVKNQVAITLNDKINQELLQFGSHYQVDGVGLDFSQMMKPQVTNDDLLSMFFNGTFYTEKAQTEPTIHPNFQVGSVSKQDFMIHMSESVINSLLKMVIQNGGLNLTQLLKDSFFDFQINYSSLKWLNPWIAKSKPDNTPIELDISLIGLSQIKLLEDTILANGTLRFTMYDENKNLVSDYKLNNVALNMTLQSRPLYAQIYGQVNSLRFDSSEIIQQGNVWLDPREILRDDSQSCLDIANSISNEYLRGVGAKENRYKRIGQTYFNELELKIADGLIFLGHNLTLCILEGLKIGEMLESNKNKLY